VVLTALGVGATVDGVIVGVEQGHHHLVGIVVVVAVLGRLVEQQLPHPLVPLEIVAQHLQQLLLC
jgi:hypothetical protein